MKNNNTRLPDELLNEFLELAAAVCNEEISDAGNKRLAEILYGNFAAQQAYGQYMLIHAELYWLEDSMARSPPAPLVSSFQPKWREASVDRLGLGRYRWQLCC